MFGAKAEQRDAFRGSRRWMRRRTPVDEVRNQPVREDRPRVGVAPRQDDAVRTLAAARDDGAEVDALRRRIGSRIFSRSTALSRPRSSARGALISSMRKRAAALGFRLIGIRPDDFEIRSRTKRDQRVARAVARMLSAGRRAHAKQFFRASRCRAADPASRRQDDRPARARRRAARGADASKPTQCQEQKPSRLQSSFFIYPTSSAPRPNSRRP